MTVIPNFILKRMYREGTLRRLPEGVAFDIVNNLGPGQISKINGISLNGAFFEATQVELWIKEERVAAESITEEAPATFFLNQVITCVIKNAEIPAGKYEIMLDLVSREAGKVTLTVKDTLAAAC